MNPQLIENTKLIKCLVHSCYSDICTPPGSVTIHMARLITNLCAADIPIITSCLWNELTL